MTTVEQWALKAAAFCLVVFVEARAVEHLMNRCEARYWRTFTGPREKRR